jgi:hypothetical protein
MVTMQVQMLIKARHHPMQGSNLVDGQLAVSPLGIKRLIQLKLAR